MIIKELNCVLIHIPKCAGTSIYNALLPDENWHDINMTNYGGFDKYNKIYKQHATAQQTKDFYCPNFESFFSFSFVRNPWDRAVSDYLWMSKLDKFHGKCLRSGSFLDYLLNKNNFSINSLKKLKPELYRYDHILPQFKFLYDSEEKQMVNFIGRFENLQEDFNYVCNKLAIPQQQLPHKNKSDHRHYTEYYDDETRDIIAKKYAKDINYFEYEFGK